MPSSATIASQPATPLVAILLCTYNGARFLAQQLDSYSSQTHGHWQVWASDDGSTDDTMAILRRYQQRWGEDRLTIIKGPRRGSCQNFMSLVHNPDIEADYYAYSDQDDIWDPDKLERALIALRGALAGQSALYCSRTRLVDERNKEIGFSPAFRRRPSFQNALMQNIAGGNTMVFNQAARSLLRVVARDTPLFIHDWWTYLAVSGCGGWVCYDPQPSLRYRQHDDNLIGMNTGWHARWMGIRRLFAGDLREWLDSHAMALRPLPLTHQNRKALEQLVAARKRRLISRVLLFKRTGVYRQTLLGNLGLVAAALFNKL